LYLLSGVPSFFIFVWLLADPELVAAVCVEVCVVVVFLTCILLISFLGVCFSVETVFVFVSLVCAKLTVPRQRTEIATIRIRFMV
jgi:hypothetical protein